MDSVANSAVLDVPESESLGFKNLDDYRILASGRDIAGKSMLSCESACYAGGAYNTTWSKALGTLGSIMAGGVSQNVFHGFPYRDIPDVAWPGFAAFSPYEGAPGYGEAWGPRMPSWGQARSVADYLGRTQMVLQPGRPRTDVAVFRQRGGASTGIGAGYFTNDGIPIGWSPRLPRPRRSWTRSRRRCGRPALPRRSGVPGRRADGRPPRGPGEDHPGSGPREAARPGHGRG